MLRRDALFSTRQASFAMLSTAVLAAFSGPAAAVSIELKDAASDRIERQRAAAEGRLPLPDTPDISRTEERLAEKGLKAGSPMLIRIFKAQSELEVWMEKDSTYELFATYPICHWSGSLGPKVRRGDKQAPEGFYTVSARQLQGSPRWPSSLNIGYPNAFDRSLARNGDSILVHGGCSSIGCYAMTNPVIAEIYKLAGQSLSGGQDQIPVHVFPFRMTAENMTRYGDSEWHSFWVNLKEGYDAFERTHRPPKVSVCDDKYHFEEQGALGPGSSGMVSVCTRTTTMIEGLEEFDKSVSPHVMQKLLIAARSGLGLSAGLASPGLLAIASRAADGPVTATNFNTRLSPAAAESRAGCSLGLASCRRFVALRERIANKRAIAAAQGGKKRQKAARAQ